MLGSAYYNTCFDYFRIWPGTIEMNSTKLEHQVGARSEYTEMKDKEPVDKMMLKDSLSIVVPSGSVIPGKSSQH